MLVFATQWVLPLIASLISGDVFSSEDPHGTLKTVLTRSVSRSAVFWGKVAAAFTFTIVAVVVPGDQRDCSPGSSPSATSRSSTSAAR